MYLPTEWMYMYVLGDIEVHEKFSILKEGKYTNFIGTMAVNSSHF